MKTTTAPPLKPAPSAGGSRRRLLTVRAGAVLAAVVASVVGLGLASTPAMADDCPNAALRAQNNSTQLPDCRAYELVTPVFKEGFAAVPFSFTDDGKVTYLSNGNFANNGNGIGGTPGGNPYLAARSASGWSTTALAPSGPEYVIGSAYPAALSSDLRSSLWRMRRSDQPSATTSDLYARRPDNVFTRIGSAIDAVGFDASDDLSHVAFGKPDGIYEYVGTSDDQPRLVSVDNAGQQLACAGQLSAPTTSYRAISSDGRVLFFSSGCSTHALYARVSGATTIDASESQCTRASSDPGGVCDAASDPLFQGANADGTRVYFTTDQQLVNADADSTTDLYECDVPAGTPAPVGPINPCPDLRQVSGAASDADVQGVTRISEDGSRVYFVAAGVLASNTDANNAVAVAGDHNMYVWQRDVAHPAGETRFVAKLDPADGPTQISGGLWGPDYLGRLAQATDDGRYLAFATYAALVDHGPQADTDSALDVYRYDAETRALTRLSIDLDGEGGNEPGHNAVFTTIPYTFGTPHVLRPRGTMTDDGGSVVFTTDEGLSPDDTNGTVDSYLWRDGRVSLISSGKPSGDDSVPVYGGSLGTVGGVQAFISPSGRDVFVVTSAQLTPNDVDTTFDVYDARIGGGFDQSPPAACAGDACQGGRLAPSPASKPGATSSTGQDGPPQSTPSFTVGKLTTAQRKRVASTGKVSLSVLTNAPGTLSAQATATLAQGPSKVGSANLAVTKAGTVSLSLTLSKKARAELKRMGKLTVKVLVSQDNVAIARTVSVKLTQSKAKKKAKRKSPRMTPRHAAAKGGRS